MNRRNRKQVMLAMSGLTAVALILILISLIVTKSGTSTKSSASDFPISINEIMSSNESYPDEQGGLHDWIELYNKSDFSVDISQYKLTDNNQKVRYTFPSGSKIEGNGYYVVYCQKNAAAPVADFSIAKTGGESIILMTSRNVAVDHIETIAMRTDEAYAKIADDSWKVLTYGTPGYENSPSGQSQYLSERRTTNNTIVINEVLASNSAYPDSEGQYFDWVELRNIGTESVFLGNYRLTDRISDIGYAFPEGTELKAGGYLIVYCDAMGQKDGYAGFAISGRSGEHVMLTDQSGKVLDEIAVPALIENQSYARMETGEYQTNDRPTPGFENSESGAEAYFASAKRDVTIAITEVMAGNRSCIVDEDGDYSDWIELTNTGGQEVNLSGLYLSDRTESDRRWPLPSIQLSTGKRIVVFCSGKDRQDTTRPHTDFSLDGKGETVSLYSPLGAVISSISYPALADDQSYCLEETGNGFFTTGFATPGYPNSDEGYEDYQSLLETPKSLTINEAMNANTGSWRQSDDNFYDWVELANRSDQPVDLSDYYLSDRLDEPTQCQLPNRKLNPDGIVTLLCTGELGATGARNAQIALSLNATQETLYLFDLSGKLIDVMHLSGLPINGSYGRMPEEGGFFYFANPTPKEENQNGFRTVSESPTASLSGGTFFQDSVKVTLSGKQTIHYTLDGSIPASDSPVYSEPLTFRETTVLRACVLSEQALPSRIVTNTYFINPEHELPIVALTVDPEEMFGTAGITSTRYRYDPNYEKLAHVEYYYAHDGFATDCGIRLHGDMSRVKSGRNKRSYKLLFREQYGLCPVNFSIFQDDPETVNYSLVLRNGSDALQSVIKDELITNIAARTSPQLCVMDSRYCALYINGQYEGLYPIRQGLSKGYYSVRYGVSKDSVRMHRPGEEEDKDFQALLSYASNHDLTQEEDYRFMESKIDFDSVIDWMIYQAYTANSDVEGNVRYYRSTEGDGKWRYALFDLDYGMKSSASFQYLMTGSWNIIPRKLLKNPEFLDRFLTRFAYLLEHDLSQESVLAEFDQLTDLIQPELLRDRERWPRPEDRSYEFFFDRLKKIILQDRTRQLKQSFSDELRIPMSQIEAYFS